MAKKQQDHSQSTLAALMEAVGLAPRKKLARSGVRFLGMNGAFGNGRVRHCSTWDFDYKLPRSSGRSRNASDFFNR